MKFLFILLFLIIFALILKPQCSRRQVDMNCRVACNDLSYDFKGAVKTGIFTYQCECKDWPRHPPEIYPQR